MSEAAGEGSAEDSSSSSQRDRTKPPRHHELWIAHPGRILTTAAVLVILLAASFLAGYLFRAPDWQTSGKQAVPVEVWTAVEQRVVDARPEFAGSIYPGSTAEVQLNPSALGNGSGESAIVVRQTQTPGARVSAGSLAAVVSGRPFFLMPGPLPLYRGLKFKDSGDDVLALQTSLAQLGHPVSRNGLMDWDTLAASAELFRQAGFPLRAPGKPDSENPLTLVVPHGAFLTLPGSGGQVVSSAAVGTVLEAGKPLLTVRTGAQYAEFVADVLQADALKTGQAMIIRAGAKEYPGTISMIGAFQAAKDGGRSGKPVRVSFADNAPALPETQMPATVLARGEEEKASLALPLTAIRGDPQGSYVLKRSSPATPDPGEQHDGSTPTPTTRVPVTILRSGGGYVAIDGALKAGESIRLT